MAFTVRDSITDLNARIFEVLTADRFYKGMTFYS
jgi:hypothetical protein